MPTLGARERTLCPRGDLLRDVGAGEQVLPHGKRSEDGRTGDQVTPRFLQRRQNAAHLFGGVTNATLSHNEGFHFSRLGCLIERADKTTRLLDVKYFVLLPSVSHVGTTYDDIQWAAVLRSASAFEMYRKRFGRISPPHIVEFLLLDHEFPRSVHFCLMKADRSLHAITGTNPGSFHNAAEQRLGQIVAELSFAQISDVLRSGFHEFLDGLQIKLNVVGDAIHDTFFALRPIGNGASVG